MNRVTDRPSDERPVVSIAWPVREYRLAHAMPDDLSSHVCCENCHPHGAPQEMAGSFKRPSPTSTRPDWSTRAMACVASFSENALLPRLEEL